ncbi:MAG: hypothetical protein MZV64_64770 [Ignavibacteriales bacterium]|nr:hypothetical protein [Ignavibacteriales bacterium]
MIIQKIALNLQLLKESMHEKYKDLKEAFESCQYAMPEEKTGVSNR